MRISPDMPGRTRQGSPARLLIRTHWVRPPAAFGRNEERTFGPQVMELDILPGSGDGGEDADRARTPPSPDRSNSG